MIFVVKKKPPESVPALPAVPGFCPALWLVERGFTIDDAGVALDKMQDESMGASELHLMLDCIDDAMFQRTESCYRFFPRATLNCYQRVRDPATGNYRRQAMHSQPLTVAKDTAGQLLSFVHEFMAKLRPFTTKTPLTGTRSKHLALAGGHAGELIKQLLVVAQLSPPDDEPIFQRLALRVSEGARLIEAYKGLMNLRIRYGADATRSRSAMHYAFLDSNAAQASPPEE